MIHDVLMVPVSVSYEKLLSHDFGLKNFQQIIFKWLKIIFNGFWGKTHGQVRVNFGQPFSLNVFFILKKLIFTEYFLKEFILNHKEKFILNKMPIDRKLNKHLNFGNILLNIQLT